MRRIATVAAIGLFAIAVVPSSAVSSGDKTHSRGCNSKACMKRVCKTAACKARVHAKQQAHRPFRWAQASWYGPGFYGHPLACGGTLRYDTHGVAHKTLPCGNSVRICAARCMTVRVVDRGPYVAGREFDITAATKNAIGFGGTGAVRVRIGG